MKNETIEEAAEKHRYGNPIDNFIRGAKWQAERSYSQEEINEIISASWLACEDNEGETFTEARKRILETFKKQIT